MRAAACIAVTLLTLAVLTGSAAAQYAVTDLGTLGGPTSFARGINSAGQVVGYAAVDASTFHAFRWDGTLHDLGTLGGPNSYAYGINDAGIVVGAAQNADPGAPQRPMRVVGVTMSDLGDLGGPTGTAYGINTAGDIAGTSDTSPTFGNAHGFLWRSGAMTDLLTLGGQFSVAFGIDDSVRVVGTAFLAGNTSNHAVRWRNGLITDLFTLGGSHSVATAINSAGTASGYSTYPGGGSHDHAFLRPLNGGLLDLSTLGGSDSQGWAINRLGQAVGWSTLAGDLVRHAFIANGVSMVDLNSLLPGGSGWELNEAYAINAAGQISGFGTHNGQSRAFLLTPATLAVGPATMSGTSFAGASPNPVRGSATFAYTLPAPGRTRLALYDVGGRLTRMLQSGEQAAGRHDAAWDGRDAAGTPVTAGLYFARLESSAGTLTRRVSVVRE